MWESISFFHCKLHNTSTWRYSHEAQNPWPPFAPTITKKSTSIHPESGVDETLASCMRQTEITWCRWGQALPSTTTWKSTILLLLTSSKEKMEFAGDLVPLVEEIEQCPSSALSSQIVFLLSVYLQRNSCLYFSGLHNARLEAGRWTHLTSGVMWQTLLWFNCCLGGNGGWVWHNNISQNNGHLVYIESFFLWFQSKSQA